jgi:hypothetical protein
MLLRGGFSLRDDGKMLGEFASALHHPEKLERHRPSTGKQAAAFVPLSVFRFLSRPKFNKLVVWWAKEHGNARNG